MSVRRTLTGAAIAALILLTGAGTAFAETVTIVFEQKDDRVVREFEPLQRLQHGSNLMIHVRGGGIV